MPRAVAVSVGLFAVVALCPGAQAATSPQLSVRVTGNGTVSSAPAGIACPADCSEEYALVARVPQSVALTATPGPGQVLQGWGGGGCSGNGSCTVVMSASKVVTAAFGPAPPPAPVSRATGTLTVDPTAGGTASGLSGAIACPPDCTETVAQGTPFGLTAVPQPGFAFDHWEGACAGAAACSGAVGAKTYVKAVFVGLAPNGRPAATDTDHDGVADARDACPSSPRRSKGASGGCSTTDVVRNPSATLAALRARLSRARLGLNGVPGMQPVLRGLAAVGRLLAAGDTLVTAGDPCGASRQLRRSAASLRSSGARAAKLLAALESSVFAQRFPPGFGDVGDKDVRVAELHYRMRLLDDAVAFGRSAAKAFAVTCKTFAKKVVLRGRVTSTDDASGLVRLNTGRQLLLPARERLGNRVFEGAVVKVTGKGGSGKDPVLTTEVTTVGSSTSPPLKVVPCMTIRIAPVQDFSVPSPVLHQTGGYLKNGVLQLEGGMRVAAGPKCPAAKSGRYSLAVELLSGTTTWDVASDLDPGDSPAVLPLGSSSTQVTLRVHERRQSSNCPPPSPSSSGNAAKSYPCPVVELSKTDYKVRLRPRGSYATAVYSSTLFPLEVEAPSFVTVTGLTATDSSLPATASLEAEGYDTTGTVNTGSYQKIVQGQEWTLYPKQLYGFTSGLLFPLDTLGVDHFAGLLWPRVVGKRGGKPYRYSAKLPKIITDVLSFCPGQGEDCYYAPPWAFQDARMVVQGNGPGAFSHNGNQQYAFDLAFATGDEIRAARGGVVGDVVDTLTTNYNPCVDPSADGPANYVRIDHQDGTYGYYAHLKPDTVPLTVGQEIGRGAVIGQADNTGRSCGPHLHFQASVVNTNSYYGQTTEILFDLWVQGQASPYSQPCYLPKTGDVLISTNG